MQWRLWERTGLAASRSPLQCSAPLIRVPPSARCVNHQVNFSDVSVTVNAGAVQPLGGSSGFTLGKGARDAGRVLTVAAGVALIVLAALVTVALLVAIVWWVGAAIRRRRREQALDTAWLSSP
jgi:hypothetical protein